ncbi:MAG: cytochrome-c peroxidase, partial [Opitutales bacterium]|nr:cytochrome-c peroxidase [Opitutales bacterium]
MEWVKSAREEFAKSTQAADEFRLEPVRPLSPAPATDPKKVALGKELFNDARLSADGTVSCATCHNLSFGGVDRLRYSKGVGGKLGGVNAPTVFNSAFQHRQFWDGRAANLEEQAGGPPVNPLEMASASWDEICKRLEADEGFKKRFLESYPEGISQKTVCAAIAEFERTLVTPNAPFDKFLKGDKSALTQEQIEGYELFKKAKCATCHAGHNLGGQSFEYMGVLRDYFKDRGGATDADKGLYNFQKDDKNLGKFKTPTLRNVALTYPYFHDGSVSSPEDAAAHMLKYQSGVKLSKGDIKKIAAFLESLTGEFEGKSLAEKGEKTAQ